VFWHRCGFYPIDTKRLKRKVTMPQRLSNQDPTTELELCGGITENMKNTSNRVEHGDTCP
jgi:hypothetical protein